MAFPAARLVSVEVRAMSRTARYVAVWQSGLEIHHLMTVLCYVGPQGLALFAPSTILPNRCVTLMA